MPDIVGRLRPPRLAAAPASPALGEMYYDTASNTLYWWSGSAWVPAKDAGGASAAEVNVSTAGPSPRVGELLWVDTDDATGQVSAPLVTALPSTPVDGQQVMLQTSTMLLLGVAWLLRYQATLAKWLVQGGAPLVNEVNPFVAGGSMTGPDETTTSTTYADLTTTGPTIAIPVNGTYLVEISCWGRNVTTARGDVYMSYAIGGTAASDADGINIKTETADQGLAYGLGRRAKTLTPVTLLGKYKAPSGTTVRFRGPRTMIVTPITLG